MPDQAADRDGTAPECPRIIGARVQATTTTATCFLRAMSSATRTPHGVRVDSEPPNHSGDVARGGITPAFCGERIHESKRGVRDPFVYNRANAPRSPHQSPAFVRSNARLECQAVPGGAHRARHARRTKSPATNARAARRPTVRGHAISLASSDARMPPPQRAASAMRCLPRGARHRTVRRREAAPLQRLWLRRMHGCRAP